eukprot:16447906-Heterocapsa_arctica.AAC.1
MASTPYRTQAPCVGFGILTLLNVYRCSSISCNTDNAQDCRGQGPHSTALFAARELPCQMSLERFNPPMVGGIPPKQAG